MNDPVSNIDVDGLSSVNPLLQMLQCQGVVLRESIKIGLTQAISGLANGLAQNLQQKNTTQQAGKQANQNTEKEGRDYLKFTKTAVDIDGGKDAYHIDDEGSVFINPSGVQGGILKVKGKWQTQKNDPNKYLSPTAAIKNSSIKESDNCMIVACYLREEEQFFFFSWSRLFHWSRVFFNWSFVLAGTKF